MSEIKPNECGYIWTSLSAFCAENLTDFRNQPMKKGKAVHACCNNWTRRIAAEPLYLIVGVVAVVEAVVRLPFAILGSIFKALMCFDFHTQKTNSCLDHMFFGSITCIQTAIFSFEALVYNICSRVIRTDKFFVHPAPITVK